jgi:uncharacterized membrane protein YraQ (UPF0718 family)
MLVLIGLSSWKGIENIIEGFNPWTWFSFILVGFTRLIASLVIVTSPQAVSLIITGKFIGVLIISILLGWMLKTQMIQDETKDFLWESWRFVKQIFPLLVLGVFVVGMIREIIHPEWIQSLAGGNSILANFIGVVFGVFMDFPTSVEVPIAQMFLDLGMHLSPLLAYLISDPELSLQSILITAAIIGRLLAWVYVGWVALFSIFSGLLSSAWVDGVSLGVVGFYLFGILALLAAIVWMLNLRNHTEVVPAVQSH